MPNRGSPVLALLKAILRPWKFRILAAASGAGYWVLYAASGGMLFYYSADITPFLRTSGIPNPYFIDEFQGFAGFYNSGVVWYPDGHLQVNLIYGPFIFSLVLSTLFSLNVVLTVFSARFTHIRRSAGSVGALALIPALFSGGCCSVPFGVALVSVFAPTFGLATLVYQYPYLINLTFVALMLLSLWYVGRKVASIGDPQPG